MNYDLRARFNHGVAITFGVMALVIAMSFQGLSESGGGGSTAFVNPPNAGSSLSTNLNLSGSLTVSNLMIGTGNGQLISTNSAGTNQFTTSKFLPGGPNGDYFYLCDTLGNVIGRCATNAFQGFYIEGTNNGPRLSFRNNQGLLMVSNGNFEVSGNTTSDQNTTIGDGPTRTVTFNANTATVVGQLNFNQNTFSITNGAVILGAATPPANLVAKEYINGNIRADNYFYNILSPVYSVTGTNSIDFSTNMLVNITGVTAGLTITSANLLAGRSVSIIFQGTTSNITLTLPTGWVPLSPTFSSVVTNKMVAIHAIALGSSDSTVVYSISQQP